MKIEVLGPGCHKCQSMEQIVRKALAVLQGKIPTVDQVKQLVKGS